MPQNNITKPYHSLIHLGCGATPNLGEYCALAEHVWLIDADTQALDTLEETTLELDQVHTFHALADTEKRSGTFYRYSLSWASGLDPVDDATQRLYPGLRCLDKLQQPTTPIDVLLSQCLQDYADSAAHLLVLDVGRQNAALLQALEESGMLGRLAMVIVLPAHRREQPVSVPPSLHRTETPPKGLTLPENCQVLVHHPLLLQLKRYEEQIADYETRLTESVKQQTEQHAEALTAERAKTAELAKERDQFVRQRDEQRDKSELLVKERDDLKHQLDEALKHREEALHQNHENHQAKSTAEARVARLETELENATQQAEQNRQQLHQEQDQRQQLIEEEVFKAVREEDATTKSLTDDFYRTYEDKFRGSRELIKQRVSVYLPFVRPIAARHPSLRALDLGCGRGDWLEVLKEAGIAGDGIDQDAGMLDGCEALGLTVKQGDALEYLREQPTASRMCISLIHVVEHIPFEMVRMIVMQAKRVLVPDGILIMETPNPENYTVGSCTFYTDPTHRNPLPPPLLAFVPEYYSFERIKVLRLQEADETRAKSRFELEDFLTGISPDYAVIAQASLPTINGQDREEQHAWEREYGISFSLMKKQNSSGQYHDE